MNRLNHLTSVKKWMVLLAVLYALQWVYMPASLAQTSVTQGAMSPQQSKLIQSIELNGASVLKPELDAVTKKYLRRPLSKVDLIDLQRELTQAYVDAGYINSGAIIPDQDVMDGVLKVQIIEGRIARLNIHGNTSLSTSYLAAHLPATNGILHLPTLQEQLELLRRHPGVAKLNGSLQPLNTQTQSDTGNAIFDLSVTEASRRQVWVQTNNGQVSSVGQTRSEFGYTQANFLLSADKLATTLGASRGATDLSLRYSMSVAMTAAIEDVQLTAYGQANRSRVVQAPLNILDIKGRSDTSGLNLRWPMARSASASLAWFATIENRQSKNWILGEGFSSTVNVPDGLIKLNAARIGLEGALSTRTLAATGKFTWSMGRTNALEPVSNVGPSPRFTHVLLQTQGAWRLSADQQISLRLDSQWAQRSLASLEKFYVGGSATVRGYAENFAAGDQGWLVSAEYRHTLHRGTPSLDAIVFADTGAARNKDATPWLRGTLSSIGVGFGLQLSHGLNIQAAWAQPLQRMIDRSSTGSGRLHAALRWQTDW